MSDTPKKPNLIDRIPKEKRGMGAGMKKGAPKKIEATDAFLIMLGGGTATLDNDQLVDCTVAVGKHIKILLEQGGENPKNKPVFNHAKVKIEKFPAYKMLRDDLSREIRSRKVAGTWKTAPRNEHRAEESLQKSDSILKLAEKMRNDTPKESACYCR